MYAYISKGLSVVPGRSKNTLSNSQMMLKGLTLGHHRRPQRGKALAQYHGALHARGCGVARRPVTSCDRILMPKKREEDANSDFRRVERAHREAMLQEETGAANGKPGPGTIVWVPCVCRLLQLAALGQANC